MKTKRRADIIIIIIAITTPYDVEKENKIIR